MQDLNDMVYFAEVVERGGFAAAGRALGIPKSRLSRRVAELEASLGVRLLQRTTRKLSLTQAGELYFRHCAAMRDEAQAATEAVAQIQQAPRGLIRVSCPVTLAQSTVGQIIAKFLAQHPEVRIDMSVSNRAVDLVEEGIDVALRVRPSLEESGSMVVKRLGRSAIILVGSTSLMAGRERPRTLEELAAFDTVAMSAIDGRTTWQLVGPDGKEHAFVHRPRYIADDLLTLKAAVLQGIGMCTLPDYLCSESLANGRLLEVMPGWGPPCGVIHAVFPSRRGLVPAVRSFLDFLGEELHDEPLVFGSGA